MLFAPYLIHGHFAKKNMLSYLKSFDFLGGSWKAPPWGKACGIPSPYAL